MRHLLALLLMSPVLPVSAQTIAGNAVDDALAEAQNGLSKLKEEQRVSLPNAAVLGSPITMAYVHVDGLLKFAPGGKLKELADPDLQSKLYPVVFEGTTYAGVMLHQKDKKWTLAEDPLNYNQFLARDIGAARDARLKSNPSPLESFSVLEIPGLGASFLVEPANPQAGIQETMLTPIRLHPTLPLTRKDGTKTANEVLGILSVHAQKIVDSPEFKALQGQK
ncbi:MAG TPA: hypothetical protein VNI01_06810 [Elusimicrobiota bacterium]|jgi:hypothetical protein|nr:hypothetical protein [Elusimicrobiota bacterium]